MGISNDFSASNPESVKSASVEKEPQKKIKKPEKGAFDKDTVEFKNEDQLERERVNKELEESRPAQEEKKPNKLKILFHKLFGKKPNNEKNYNYDNNPPPYDK